MENAALGHIHSMTAFARESSDAGQSLLTVELRTVNHRYLDCSFKLPDSIRSLEPQLREQIGKALARGKVDCMVRMQPIAGGSDPLHINKEHLENLARASEVVRTTLATREPTVLEVLQFPGVCSAPEQSEETLHSTVLALFQKALKTLVTSRAREGEKLSGMISERLAGVEEQVANTRSIVPALLQQQRDRLIARINDIGADVDQGRLEQELVFMAQKSDVDEELDRLTAHIGEVNRALKKGGPCGRRLDFLMQELNREANTLSSKSTSSDTTQSAVELKVLIEQMREQIQNIE